MCLLLLLSITSLTGQSKMEKLETYKASNGVTYKVGDNITLAKGSDTNGDFAYFRIGGYMGGSKVEPMGAHNTGLIVTIKKIKKYNKKRIKSVLFTVGAGAPVNYILDIENAISSCEITPCESNTDKVVVKQDDKYDQLAKIKKLYDEGVLSEEEYESEKKKILGS